MSPYERMVISNDIQDDITKAHPAVYKQVVPPYKEAINKYKNSLASIEQEKTKEIQRFNAARLNEEMAYVTRSAEMALSDSGSALDSTSSTVHEKLRALYDEAKRSGNLEKQRATFEVIQSVLPKAPGKERIEINSLAKEAQRDLAQLRRPESLLKAEQDAQSALQEVAQRQAEVAEAAELLEGNVTNIFATGSLIKAYKLVQQDATGKVFIYDENDPEVSGVFWK